MLLRHICTALVSDIFLCVFFLKSWIHTETKGWILLCFCTNTFIYIYTDTAAINQLLLWK